ncbi:hypothetical protein [Actinomyces minihominis]|uniref:hypothetical protein n=1 Tax=Actinomyces minihominis TaxID=2002838 RepID=UPI000C06E7A5|nr:hypothetical protein [Actinomyces minihominis]
MQDIDRKSLGLGVLVYVMWGFFPLYFVLLGPAGSLEVIVHLGLLVGAGIITLIPLLLFARASRGLPLAVMGLLQYIGPILQMFIGVVIFKEVMEPARWIATGIIWLGVLVLSADWIRQLHRQR